MSTIPKLSGTERGGNYCGRRGLPPDWVDQMYADWKRLRSLRAVARLHGRTNQAVHEIFKRRGFETNRNFHQPIFYKGNKYTPCKGGFRRTDQREKCHRMSFLHHVIWVEEFGPIPAGHQVSFKNGDRTDFRPENLICLPRAKMSALHATGENGFTATAKDRLKLLLRGSSAAAALKERAA